MVASSSDWNHYQLAVDFLFELGQGFIVAIQMYWPYFVDGQLSSTMACAPGVLYTCIDASFGVYRELYPLQMEDRLPCYISAICMAVCLDYYSVFVS